LSASTKLAAGAIGLIVGLPIGVVVAIVGNFIDESIPFALWVFSSAAALSITCATFSEKSIECLPHAISFVLGALPNASNWKIHHNLDPSKNGDIKKISFKAGVVFSVCLVIFIVSMKRIGAQ
jgi:hypothetical protein